MLLLNWVGLPKEVLTDQCTPFMSKWITVECFLCQVKQFHTSKYYLQSDGLVERLNQTFKWWLGWIVNDGPPMSNVCSARDTTSIHPSSYCLDGDPGHCSKWWKRHGKSSTNYKLLAQWQGPITVAKQILSVNYRLQQMGNRKCFELKKFKPCLNSHSSLSWTTGLRPGPAGRGPPFI